MAIFSEVYFWIECEIRCFVSDFLDCRCFLPWSCFHVALRYLRATVVSCRAFWEKLQIACSFGTAWSWFSTCKSNIKRTLMGVLYRIRWVFFFFASLNIFNWKCFNSSNSVINHCFMVLTWSIEYCCRINYTRKWMKLLLVFIVKTPK